MYDVHSHPFYNDFKTDSSIPSIDDFKSSMERSHLLLAFRVVNPNNTSNSISFTRERETEMIIVIYNYRNKKEHVSTKSYSSVVHVIKKMFEEKWRR